MPYPTIDEFRADPDYLNASEGEKLEFDRRYFTGAEDFMATNNDEWNVDDARDFATQAQEDGLISDRTLPGSIYTSIIGNAKGRDVRGFNKRFIDYNEEMRQQKLQFNYPTQEEYDKSWKESSLGQRLVEDFFTTGEEALTGIGLKHLRDVAKPFTELMADRIERGNLIDTINKKNQIAALIAAGNTPEQAEETYKKGQSGLLKKFATLTRPELLALGTGDAANSLELGIINSGMALAAATTTWVGFDELGKSLRGIIESEGERLGMTTEQRRDMQDFNPNDMLKSAFWLGSLPEAVGSSLPLIAPAALAGLATGGGSITPTAIVMGHIINTPLEATFEASLAYNEALSQGLSKEQAGIAGQTSFANNFVVAAGTNSAEAGFEILALNVAKGAVPAPLRPVLNALPKGKIAKLFGIAAPVLASGAIEGYQEVYQGYINEIALESAREGNVAFDIETMKELTVNTARLPQNLPPEKRLEFVLGAFIGSGMNASIIGASKLKSIEESRSDFIDEETLSQTEEAERQAQYDDLDLDISNNAEVLERTAGLDDSTALVVADMQEHVADLRATVQVSRERGRTDIAEVAERELQKMERKVNEALTLGQIDQDLSTRPPAPLINGELIFNRNIDELEEDLEQALDDDANLLERLFGEEGAKKYKALEHKANSLTASFKDTNKASDDLQDMQDTLIKEEQNELFGIDQQGVAFPDDIKEVLRRKRLMDRESPQDLANSLKTILTDLPKTEDVQSGKELGFNEISALGALKEAQNIIAEEGFNADEVMDLAIQAAASTFTDPQDAIFMLERFINPKTEGAQDASTRIRESTRNEEEEAQASSQSAAQEEIDLLAESIVRNNPEAISPALQDDGTLNRDVLMEVAGDMGIVKDNPLANLREYSAITSVLNDQMMQLISETKGDTSLDTLREFASEHGLTPDLTKAGAEQLVDINTDINNHHHSTQLEDRERRQDVEGQSQEADDVDQLISDTGAFLDQPAFSDDANYLEDMLPDVEIQVKVHSQVVDAQYLL